MPDSRKNITDRNPSGKWSARVNAVLQLCIIFALLAGINYLAYRHPDWFVPANWFSKEKKVRFDLKEGFKYTLSQQTEKILSSLTEPVDVYVIFSPQSDIYQRVVSLLREYERVSPKIKVKIVDKDRDFSLVRELASTYRFSDRENLVIFSCASRSVIIDAYDLAEYEPSGTAAFGASPDMRLTSFKAEQRFTSALKVVSESKKRKVYYLQGHGEPALRGDGDEDYGGLALALERENVDVVIMDDLPTEAMIPADCDLLMIIDPKSQFLPQEIKAIESYLSGQGKLLLAIAPRVKTGLEPLMAKYGVKLDDDSIIGYISIMGVPTLSESAVVQTLPGHPVTDVISRQNINLIFPAARSVSQQAPSPDIIPAPKISPLSLTFKGFWGEKGPLVEGAKFDEKTDLAGPLPVALAVEVGQLESKEVEVNTTKMVIVGSALFASNRSLSTNYDFLLNAVNWLLSRDQMIGIAPKPIEQFALNLSANQLNSLVLIISFGVPAVAALMGVLVWFRRRK